MDLLQCGWDHARFLIFSTNVYSNVIYYSHLLSLFFALVFGVMVIRNNARALANRALFFITVLFGLWVFCDLAVWANEMPELVMFFWNVMVLVEVLIYAICFYFVYVYIYGNNLAMRYRLGIGVLSAPVILLLSTTLNLEAFDLTNCDRNAVEGFIATYYVYVVEILLIAGIIIISLRSFIKRIGSERKKTVLVSLGSVIFLGALSFGNIVGSLTDNWNLAQYGLFGMPIFIGFLTYLVVKYREFDVKLLGAQALIMAVAILIGSQFLFVRNPTNRVLTAITFFLVLVFGYILIRSIKQEIQRKEELQMMADRLAEANQRLKKLDQAKSDFISIASHQLRTPLTSIKGFISLILEGSYGIISGDVQNALNKVYLSNERLIHLVEDLLNISRIESGKLQFRMEECNIGELLSDIREMFVLRAREKGLELSLFIRDEALPTVFTDGQKVREIISNLVDNAIKYSERGEVSIIVERTENIVRISVKDEGMGIEPEEIGYLFQKFSRGKDIGRVHANGTGLGLYVGKHLIEALGGSIHVSSRGQGQGSVFSIELPLHARGNLSQSTERDVFTSV